MEPFWLGRRPAMWGLRFHFKAPHGDGLWSGGLRAECALEGPIGTRSTRASMEKWTLNDDDDDESFKATHRSSSASTFN
mgnify:CR=1 FL=1